MKLKDLKRGMVGEVRNKGSITVVNRGSYFTSDFLTFALEERYNDDLTHKKHKHLDIMEITYGDKVVFERNESRWFVPKGDEKYFFTNSFGEVASKINMQMPSDNDVLKNNRVFKTREEAEKRLEQQQATLSVERWIAENDIEVDVYDTDKTKYYIVHDIERKELKVDYYNHYITAPKQFILTSAKKAEELIKEREKELKIMFGVEGVGELK